jgi:hypothetical protein
MHDFPFLLLHVLRLKHKYPNKAAALFKKETNKGEKFSRFSRPLPGGCGLTKAL